MRKPIPTVLLLGMLLVAAAMASAQGRDAQPPPPSLTGSSGMNGPEAGTVPGPLLSSHSAASRAIRPQSAPQYSSPILQGLLWFYRGVVSPVDGDRCDMAPSCSLYAVRALRTHGAFLGTILTADRLLHEADEQRFVAPLRGRGPLRNETHYPDPLAHNVYWLPAWMGGAEPQEGE